MLEYTTAASTSFPTLTGSTINPSITADVLAAGSGITANTGGTYNWRGFDGSTSFAEAVTAGDFWIWGFDVNPSYSVDLTTMDIRVDRSGTGPPAFEIRASINGGTAVSLLSETSLSDAGTTYSGIDLSSLATLNAGDSIVFQLAAWGASASAGTFDLEPFTGSGGLTLNGDITTAVPEPSTYALLGIGLVGLFAWRGRSRRRSAAQAAS